MAARTVTLRLSEATYATVKRYAADDQRSMNAWIETLLDAEDMRRRCVAHERYLSTHPDAVTFSEAWADRNLEELAGR